MTELRRGHPVLVGVLEAPDVKSLRQHQLKPDVKKLHLRAIIRKAFNMQQNQTKMQCCFELKCFNDLLYLIWNGFAPLAVMVVFGVL